MLDKEILRIVKTRQDKCIAPCVSTYKPKDPEMLRVYYKYTNFGGRGKGERNFDKI